jgi:hypothetical protein
MMVFLNFIIDSVFINWDSYCKDKLFLFPQLFIYVSMSPLVFYFYFFILLSIIIIIYHAAQIVPGLAATAHSCILITYLGHFLKL